MGTNIYRMVCTDDSILNRICQFVVNYYIWLCFWNGTTIIKTLQQINLSGICISFEGKKKSVNFVNIFYATNNNAFLPSIKKFVMRGNRRTGTRIAITLEQQCHVIINKIMWSYVIIVIIVIIMWSCDHITRMMTWLYLAKLRLSFFVESESS